MIRRMLDILVCPFDKETSLELYELNTRNLEKTGEKLFGEDSKLQNYKIDGPIMDEKEISDNSSNSIKDTTKEDKKNNIDILSKDSPDNDVIIEEGILFCNTCSRFYPIVEEIPIILPDDLRDKNKDLELLKKWSNTLPEKVVKKALPWHL